MRTHREDVVCNSCQAEFFIEYSDVDLMYCPFCGEDIDNYNEGDEDDYEEWDQSCGNTGARQQAQKRMKMTKEQIVWRLFELFGLCCMWSLVWLLS